MTQIQHPCMQTKFDSSKFLKFLKNGLCLFYLSSQCGVALEQHGFGPGLPSLRLRQTEETVENIIHFYKEGKEKLDLLKIDSMWLKQWRRKQKQ